MPRTNQMVVGLVAGMLAMGGCYGPFNLTRRLHQWNGQVGDKWIQEAVFIVFVWAPVYGLAGLGDAIVFNTIEFWGGKNPVSPPPVASLPRTRRLIRGDHEALLTYASQSDGSGLLIEQFHDSRSAGSLRIEQRDGLTVGVDADGKALVTAQTLPDGSLLVRDSEGKVIASYSARDVERMLAAAARW